MSVSRSPGLLTGLSSLGEFDHSPSVLSRRLFFTVPQFKIPPNVFWSVSARLIPSGRHPPPLRTFGNLNLYRAARLIRYIFQLPPSGFSERGTAAGSVFPLCPGQSPLAFLRTALLRNRRANWKHGLYSAEAKAERRLFREFLEDCRQFL
jgi:hypothetical protein